VAKRIALTCLLVLPLLTGMRDPFRPLPDRCQFALLGAWRLQGVVMVDENPVGIAQDPAGRWRRLREQETLLAGWKIVRINKEEVALENGHGCNTASWRMNREGTQDDKTRNGNTLPLPGDDQSQREGKREK